MSRNSSELLAGGMQAKAFSCRRLSFVFVGGVNEKWSLRYVVGPRSIQMDTVMRSVLSARHEERAQRAHLLVVGGSGRELSAKQADNLHEPCLS